ncbi:MAG: hypothetical protein AAFX55_20545 [Bacteroidota bacterium]
MENKNTNSVENTDQNKESGKENGWIIAVIFFIIFLFIITAGAIQNLFTKKEELEKKKEKALVLHKVHLSEAEIKKQKKEQLDRQYKRIHLLVRMTIVLLFFGINSYIHFIIGLDLETLILYNNIALFAYISLAYVANGNIKEYSKSFESLGEYIRKQVFRNYPNIDAEISEKRKLAKKQLKIADKVDKELVALNEKIELIGSSKVTTEKLIEEVTST